MRIACVNCTLAGELRKLGHEVLSLSPAPGIFPIGQELRQRGFRPDLLLQQETLGPRILLSGLNTLSCIKVFWSVDTHLNISWHRYYGRLFDLVATTQADWVPVLENLGIPACSWLPWYGFESSWTPWKERPHLLSFIGRVTAHRPTRNWFLQFLQNRYLLNHKQDISLQELKRLYSRTRLAPNESIGGEVNFRTFEAASCGCVVLNQDVGGVDQLFVPDREIVLYSHVLELKSKLDYLLQNETQARNIGSAARERVLREHLPEHRAHQLLKMVTDCPGNDLSPPAKDAAWWLTLLTLCQENRYDAPAEYIKNQLLSLPAGPDSLRGLLYLVGQDFRQARDILLPILKQRQFEEDLLFNAACSALCLRHGEWSLAKQFWYRYGRSGKAKHLVRPEGGVELLLFWARELRKKRFWSRPGFRFHPEDHLPESALECLILAHEMDPGNRRVVESMGDLARRSRGMEPFHIQLLSHLTLHDPENWRLGLDLALSDLHAFRMAEGVEELALAREIAQRNGEEGRFMAALSGRDRSGIVSHLFSQGCLSGNGTSHHA